MSAVLHVIPYMQENKQENNQIRLHNPCPTLQLATVNMCCTALQRGENKPLPPLNSR